MKRLLDLLGAGIGLIVTGPLLLAVALSIRCSSPGPVLFVQRRVGRNFRPFRIYKFRTMLNDVLGPGLTSSGDARVTRLGRLLRRTKIDELPQLLNVLKGEMSLVGPRPELPRYVEMFPDEFREILTVRPGMTDPASLAYRDEEARLAAAEDPEREYTSRILPDKILRSREYLRRASLVADLALIARTLEATARPGAATACLVVFAMLWLLGAFHLITYASAEAVWLPRFHNLGFGLVALLATLPALAGRQVPRAWLRATWPLLLPVLLAFASAAWSLDPYVSLRSSLALAGSTALGFYLALRFELDDQLALLGSALALGLAASLVLALTWPEIGVASYGRVGSWSGLFGNSNHLGKIAALGVIVFSFLALRPGPRRALALLGVALATGLMLASRSRSAQIAALCCLGATAVAPAVWRRPRALAALVAVGAVAAASLAALPAASVFDWLGRGPTLSGRTQIWSELIEVVGRRPWLGYGFHAFWGGASPELSATIERIGKITWHGHNGFLDLTLEIGLVGLALFAIPFAIHALRCLRVPPGAAPLRRWPLAYLIFFAMSNLTESSLVRFDGLYWVLYVAAVATWHRPPASERHRAPPTERFSPGLA